MCKVRFEWDDKKAETNIRKHGVSFEEAQTVFRYPLSFIFDDEAHSVSERREIVIGYSENNPLLIVCFSEETEGVVRIFRSRPAIGKERRDYEENTMFRIR